MTTVICVVGVLLSIWYGFIAKKTVYLFDLIDGRLLSRTLFGVYVFFMLISYSVLPVMGIIVFIVMLLLVIEDIIKRLKTS